MIEIDKITERQKLIIRKGLLDYKYIMDNWKKNDEDFQKVYYEFYLKARFSVLNDRTKKIYFDLLKQISPKDDLMYILGKLEFKEGEKEFSIASKLLHTRNDLSPIYDSKVRKYLLKEENVKLEYLVSSSKRTSKEQKIKNDWLKINQWYNDYCHSQRGKEWIQWFNANFKEFTDISDVKKIDFIIFACTD